MVKLNKIKNKNNMKTFLLYHFNDLTLYHFTTLTLYPSKVKTLIKL
jgi:hypothetical protein